MKWIDGPPAFVAHGVVAARLDLLLGDVVMSDAQRLKLTGPEGRLGIGLLTPALNMVGYGRLGHAAHQGAEPTEWIGSKLG